MTTTYGRRHPDGSPVDQREPADFEPSERTWCRTCGSTLVDGACPTHGANR